MKFSNRINDINYSNVRKLVPFMEAAQKEGVYVHEMHIGQPNLATPQVFLDSAKGFEEKVLKYTNSKGIEPLLEAFSNDYNSLGIKIAPNDMLITQGGSEALTFTIATICDEGDQVLIFEPFYSNYDSFLKLSGATMVTAELKIENQYALPSKEEILSQITDKTKAILFSNPNNPIGAVLTEDEMKTICEIAIEKDLFIIADEVYRHFIYGNEFYKSFLEMDNVEDRVIVIDSISKNYSACGARVGVIASKNKEFIAQGLKLCQARLSVSTIDQVATASLLGNANQYIIDSRETYKERRDTMCDLLASMEGVTCVAPKSALYAFVQLPIDDTDDFAEWMLRNFRYNNETISFAPGSGFYCDSEKGKQKVRFSFCASTPDEIIRAMKILEEGMKAYKNK